MTRKDEVETEIRMQAIMLYPKCAALFELPNMVYCQLMQDDVIRKSRTVSVMNAAKKSSVQ